jgi:hypothetical protein
VLTVVDDEIDVTDGDGLFEAPARAAAPLALYRRYRPDTFAQVIGQEHVTEPLQRALVNNRVASWPGPSTACGPPSPSRAASATRAATWRAADPAAST